MARDRRRLAVIVIIDAVGYSRLMGQNESATHTLVQTHLAVRVAPSITRNGGRVVKFTGDGAHAEFDSAVNALSAIIELQQAMADANRDQADATRIVFRAGLHLGEVIVEDGDLFGDDVNIAVRLQSEAPPGGILISRSVREAVEGRINAELHALGEMPLKNIVRPIQVFRVEWNEADWRPQATATSKPPHLAVPTAAALALPDRPSIAVLPFENMSGDSEQEYFADGIVEDIITALSRFKSLFVIARNSSFAYKGKSPDVRQVGKELGVRYLLEGSVRKAGSRIRLSAQLLDGATGNHIWAERFDRQLADVFAIQDELTAIIAGAIEPALSLAEQQRVKAKRPENLSAWDLYLQGMSRLHRRTAIDLQSAQHFFARAIETDPTLVSAYSGAAECCFFQIVGGFAAQPDRLREQGLKYARQAVELDKVDAGARYALGRLHTVRREAELAIPELQEAIQLNPNFAWAHYALGFAYGASGQPQQAITPIAEAMRLSPHDPYLGQFMVHMGLAYLLQGQHDQALEWAERSLREPNIQWSRHLLLIAALGYLGRHDRSKRAIADLHALRPGMTVALADEWWPLSDGRSRLYLMDGWRKAGLPE